MSQDLWLTMLTFKREPKDSLAAINIWKTAITFGVMFRLVNVEWKM